SLFVHHCGSVPVPHTHRSPQLKMQSSESSGGNLRLLTSCSAPFSRASGRQATKVYSGQGADIVMQSLEIHIDGYAVYQDLQLISVQSVNRSALVGINCRAK